MMTFEKDALVNGTSLQGYVYTTYADLVRSFGEPDSTGDGEKVTCEWCLEFEDGTVATIYDWKEEQTPFGQYGWHIGGRSYEAVERVMEYFEDVKV